MRRSTQQQMARPCPALGMGSLEAGRPPRLPGPERPLVRLGRRVRAEQEEAGHHGVVGVAVAKLGEQLGCGPATPSAPR